MRTVALSRTAVLVNTLLALVCATSVSATELSDAAEALQPGQWMVFDTDGFGGSLLGACDESHSILEWANKATWDPVAHEVHFVGQGHVTCAKHIRYQESTNRWSTAALPSGIGSFGHAYEHNTVNPVNGDFYYRNYNSSQIEKYNSSTDSWTPLPPIDTSTQVAGAIEYFPEENGILYVDGDFGIYYYSTQTNAWSFIANTAAVIDPGKPQLDMASYHNFASYNAADRVIYFGGGNDSTSVYKFDTNRQVSRVADSPVSIGIANALTVADPASGTQLIFADNGNVYALDSASNSWSTVGTHPVMSHARGWRVAAPISNYGVLMFITWDFENSKVLLHRYAPGTGSGEIKVPKSPSNFAGTPTN